MEELSTILFSAFSDCIEMMTCEAPTRKEGQMNTGGLIAEIALGPVTVWIAGTSEDIGGLYEDCMGMACDDESEVRDFLGELCNQTLGPACAALPNTDPRTLSLPKVAERIPESAESAEFEVSGRLLYLAWLEATLESAA